MTYCIWETESGNVIGRFDSEDAALLAVLDAADLNGAASVESLALVRNEAGKPLGIASGAELLKLAQQRNRALPA